ncbi:MULTISPECIES: Hsp70 family protein [Planktothricoides]|uniref:Hsp70 family protein n=2 Tax=Planktothricoides raciborskii TaxID=132608 RepID=A0AAU8JCI4_9CYAN|nr:MULTISPECIES: Hsp70 family protein [Planktothricoides]KOR35694.1 molecular chaperone [Planktothricoides sp. SR001]MBD2545814.1 Hsp70 family protein [Planktothricoides raciborskii FACHB-1370]MBD2583965.1 Hsp70 family protein [Planktothricoides raciborskii FACHB-1261]
MAENNAGYNAGYNIGLDFGTTNSIISYLGTTGELEAFQYGGPNGHKYIPSFITYEDNFIEIGTAARTTAANHPTVESYGNFKMRLPIVEPELLTLSDRADSNRTAVSVTSDYLRELLISPENPYSFMTQQGRIARLVVSVPEIWQRDIYNRGRESLQKLIQDLGLPLTQLVSEPVAAAAYYTWEMHRRAIAQNRDLFTGNLLVCDMGGGTFDVSLCRIYGNNKVEVLYFDGQGDRGLESAGVAFDRRCVQQAYREKHGVTLDENSPEFMRLLAEFEAVKIGSHGRVTRKLLNCLKAPDIYDSQVIYVFGGGYSVTYAQVTEAFAAIAQGIEAVIHRLNHWFTQQNQTIDRLFLVGGFSQFLLVEKTIRNALGISQEDERFDRNFNITNSAYAISYGACLIANGLVDPTEKYVHSLGIVVDTINSEAEREERYITLVQGGRNLTELAQPQFADIPPLFTFHDEPLTLTLWVDPQSKGTRFKDMLPDIIKLPSSSPNDQWRVGMRVDRSQICYLVIADMLGKKRVEYELGNAIAKMFPGFVLIES